MRVVLYAEGAGDEGTAARMAPAPGTVLREEWLGPAHELVRRCLEEADGSVGVQFESPLRLRGKIARGSMLKDRRNVRRLLTWARAELIPDVVVVLVDADGDHQAGNRMQDCVSNPPVSAQVIVGVAVQEFESWLVADTALKSEEALRDATIVAVSGYALPEDLRRATEAGFNHHLSKPPSLEKLRMILHEPF